VDSNFKKSAIISHWKKQWVEYFNFCPVGKIDDYLLTSYEDRPRDHINQDSQTVMGFQSIPESVNQLIRAIWFFSH
jgi:hypothetical protein